MVITYNSGVPSSYSFNTKEKRSVLIYNSDVFAYSFLGWLIIILENRPLTALNTKVKRSVLIQTTDFFAFEFLVLINYNYGVPGTVLLQLFTPKKRGQFWYNRDFFAFWVSGVDYYIGN